MKTYEDEAFDELEKSLQRKITTGVTDGSKKDVALKQALEALEDAKTHGLVYVNEIVDLRQAIAKAEKQSEPIGTAGELFTNSALERLDLRPSTKIYTTPTKRTWVALTDEEKQEIYKQADEENWHDQPLLETVEAKLKEKNT